MNETDRELLEWAAKAAGLRPCKDEICGQFAIVLPENNRRPEMFQSWNPLTDDSDALRLAVKTGIEICFYENYPKFHPAFTRAIWRVDEENFSEEDEFHGDDPYAATRRAIVRAAAEIGKAMK